MIEVIQGLINKGYAYPAQGSVYFRVRSVPDYGKLSHRSLDSMRSWATCEIGKEKEDPMDFVLWKASKPGEPEWASPWGPGRPGWHIECSAMSLTYLGETIDIHGGGQDLVFPHHENEIAQSESFTGVKPFAKYWLHNGLVQLGEEKMSKSLGNLITIKEALDKYGADALRIFVLSSHYRSPLTYSEEVVEGAFKGAERLLRVIVREDAGGKETIDVKPYEDRFIEAMDDDFNTPQAIAVLFDLARAINQAVHSGAGFANARDRLAALARDVLGLRLEESKIPLDIRLLMDKIDLIMLEIKQHFKSTEQAISIHTESAIAKAKQSGDIEDLIALRNDLRASKKYELSDKIRDVLMEMGIILEDTPKGTTWKKQG